MTTHPRKNGRFTASRFNPFNFRTFGKSLEHCLLLEVFDISNSARMITDKSGRTVISNAKFDELCRRDGPPSVESMASHLSSNPEQKKALTYLRSSAQNGERAYLEIASEKNRQTTWYKVTAAPIVGWYGYVHWNVEDITTEKVAQDKLAAERNKLLDYTDNAPVGFFSVDETGHFEFVNETLARWLGVPTSALVPGSTLHEFFVEKPVGCAPYDIKDSGGVRQYAEARIRSRDGRIFLASITQTVVRLENGKVRTRAVMNDLSAEEAIRQALKDSEDRFRRFYEEAPIGILIIDREGKIKDGNLLLARMAGKVHDTLKQYAITDMVDRADSPLVLDILERIRKGETITDPVEVSLWSGDQGRGIPCHMYASLFSGGEDIALHFLDLSQQKNLENQFIQSQKMQAVGQLAGGIAHDFNNLLTAIIGFCDLLLLRHKPGDPSFGDIQQIKQNSNRAANLVRQLLAFSRQQTLRPQVQDVTDILTELAHLLRRLIGVNIELSLIHGDDLGYVKVDSGQMEQVLVNLVVNARDAMPDGGILTIETSRVRNTDPVSFGDDVMPAGDWVLIEVKDTGTGMPAEVMERIFEPFFTTKDVGKGTGLGLATVYGIIRQTGGYLDVESRVGYGTTFSIYLPSAKPEEKASSRTDESGEDAPKDLTGNARILLVEDEDAVRTFSTRALTNKGYEVLTAENGEAGLSVFRQSLAESGKPIDLLITDVMMPGMDGPTLAKTVLETCPDLRIIFISGYTEERLKDTLGENIYFLPKPFTLKDLAAKVKDVLQT